MKSRLLCLIAIAVVLGALTLEPAVAQVSTDRTSYNFGDTVHITGDGVLPFEDVTVTIYPENIHFVEHVVQADAAGRFADTFVVNPATMAGTLHVIVTANSLGPTQNFNTDVFAPIYSAKINTVYVSDDFTTETQFPVTVEYSDRLSLFGDTLCTQIVYTDCEAETGIGGPGPWTMGFELQVKGGVLPDWTTVNTTTVFHRGGGGSFPAWGPLDWDAGKVNGSSVAPGAYRCPCACSPEGRR